ncbi:hypothetical protein ACFPIJ_05135 [Dactylosporangium cerinum]|uniref:MmyB-like transcription regulator ligand binding domain-containing protein n=1 Tax=Dactylosporangium cerinum TaxID=1434730 RepID=A0ABV9VLF1_9ACTN
MQTLLTASPEFAAAWAAHDVGARHTDLKRIAHPELGVLELYCQTLLDPDQSQALLVFTVVPGTESAEKLALLRVIAP